MTEQEKFEAWYGEHYTTYLPKTGGGEYCNLSTLLAWNTWQASRRAALEEIARGFESEHGRTRDHNYWLVAAGMVRALAASDSDGGV